MFKKGRFAIVLLILFSASITACVLGEDSEADACAADGGTWLTENSDGTALAEPSCNRRPTFNDSKDQETTDVASDPAIPADEAGADQAVGTGAGWTVRLIPLDVRTLETPPEIIAYANIEHTPPPAGVTIAREGALWTYNANVGLLEAGHQISAANANDNVTALGVRLEGDANDGWALISVDDVEVWRGSVYGDPDSEAGMFLHYLEVSGLTPGAHTITVECLGVAGAGGGVHVAMRYFGFSSAPVVVPPS